MYISKLDIQQVVSQSQNLRKRCNGANRKQSSNGEFSAKDEQQAENANGAVQPHGVYRRLGIRVDLLPVLGKQEAVVTRVRKRNSTCGNHAALAHDEASDNCDGEDGERKLLRHALHQVRGEWLAKRRAKHAGDVDDGVGDDELQKPAKDATRGRSHNNGARGSNVCV